MNIRKVSNTFIDRCNFIKESLGNDDTIDIILCLTSMLIADGMIYEPDIFVGETCIYLSWPNHDLYTEVNNTTITIICFRTNMQHVVKLPIQCSQAQIVVNNIRTHWMCGK